MTMLKNIEDLYNEQGSIVNETSIKELKRAAEDDTSAIRFIMNIPEVEEQPKAAVKKDTVKPITQKPFNFGKKAKNDAVQNDDGITMNDSGNADLLAEVLAGKVVYDIKLQAWRCFDGKIWREVDEAVVIHLAEVCLRDRAEKCDSDSDSVRYFVRSSCNYNDIRDAVKLLHCRPEFRREEFDIHPNLIAVENGVFNLDTKELQEHAPELWQTMKLAGEYIQGSFKGSQFKRFLLQIVEGDAEYAKYLQTVFGNTLNGDNLQLFYHLTGEGNNGKSLLLRVVSKVMADFHAILPKAIFTEKTKSPEAASPYLANTIGKRVVTVPELLEADVLNSAIIKQMTGGLELTARKLYKQPVQFKAEFTLFFESNYPLHFDSSDYAINRRVVVLPFSLRLADEEVDLKLYEKLTTETELAAVVEWLLAGAAKAYYKPDIVKQFPAVVEEATAEQRRQTPISFEDSVTAFIDECLSSTSGQFGAEVMSSHELYGLYQEYASQRGYSVAKQQMLSRMIRERGYQEKRIQNRVHFFVTCDLPQE